MGNYAKSAERVRVLEELAQKDSVIHRIHPVVKLLTTVIFLVVTVSFGRYDWLGIVPLALYPLILFSLTDFQVKPFLLRMVILIPFLVTMGILNPLLDRHAVDMGGIMVSRGFVTFLSLAVKSFLTVISVFLLMATTGLEEMSKAMRAVRIPKVFVLQLLLTYRYIHILTDEVARSMKAYSLRAPEHNGIRRTALSSMIGMLFLKTYDRSQRVYQGMNLRGFSGEYHTGHTSRAGKKDILYLAGWSAFFLLARMINIPVLIGNLL